MFRILNVVADELITKPSEIDQLCNGQGQPLPCGDEQPYNDVIPPETRDHIKERDGN